MTSQLAIRCKVSIDGFKHAIKLTVAFTGGIISADLAKYLFKFVDFTDSLLTEEPQYTELDLTTFLMIHGLADVLLVRCQQFDAETIKKKSESLGYSLTAVKGMADKRLATKMLLVSMLDICTYLEAETGVGYSSAVISEGIR